MWQLAHEKEATRQKEMTEEEATSPHTCILSLSILK
jgi:hypothetical protein